MRSCVSTTPPATNSGHASSAPPTRNTPTVLPWTPRAGAWPGQHSGPWRAKAEPANPFGSKYDTSCTEDWSRQLGSSGSDSGSGIAVDASGIYVAGAVAGALPGQTSAGSSDAFVRRYNSSGTEDGTFQFGT